MLARPLLLAALALSVAVDAAAAQRNRQTAQSAQRCLAGERAPSRAAGAATASARADTALYDVVLDVPDLCVDRIQLNVRNLDAVLALDARVANLVSVTAGADVHISEVDLMLAGVQAEALLLVDLDNVVFVVNRTMDFIDANADVLADVIRGVGETVGTLGGVVNRALQPGGLLSQTVDELGRTVVRVVGETGTIVERTLDTAGGVLSERTVGRVLDLPVVRETAGNAGSVVRQVRDASGRIIEYTIDAAGNVTGARVLSRTGG